MNEETKGVEVVIGIVIGTENGSGRELVVAIGTKISIARGSGIEEDKLIWTRQRSARRRCKIAPKLYIDHFSSVDSEEIFWNINHDPGSLQSSYPRELALTTTHLGRKYGFREGDTVWYSPEIFLFNILYSYFSFIPSRPNTKTTQQRLTPKYDTIHQKHNNSDQARRVISIDPALLHTPALSGSRTPQYSVPWSSSC